jgi:hypothetical protein
MYERVCVCVLTVHTHSMLGDVAGPLQPYGGCCIMILCGMWYVVCGLWRDSVVGRAYQSRSHSCAHTQLCGLFITYDVLLLNDQQPV